MIHGIIYDCYDGRQKAEMAIIDIINELRRAEAIHPGWPEDKIHAMALVCEEAGEALQAAVDTVYGGDHAGELRNELIHAGAMVIRALMHL